MAKIAFWAGSTHDGCSFYRCYEPARVLSLGNHQAFASNFITSQVMVEQDVLVAQRLHEDNPCELWRRIHTRFYSSHRPRMVYEIDDDLFHVPEHNQPSHDQFGPHTESGMNHRRNIIDAMNIADIVTTTNPHLAAQIALHTSTPIRVVPNYVPHRLVNAHAYSEPRLHRPVVVGWSGSPSHIQDVEQIIVPLRKVLRKYRLSAPITYARPHVEALITGGLDLVPRLKRVGTASFIPWTKSIDDHFRNLSNLDIGLAPLTDDLFNRSKSDIKLKEYAARGVVPIASNVGPYMLNDHPGYPWPQLADVLPVNPDSEEEVERRNLDTWISWLEFLIDDPSSRLRLAKNNIEWAYEHTLEKHIHEWEEALLS